MGSSNSSISEDFDPSLPFNLSLLFYFLLLRQQMKTNKAIATNPAATALRIIMAGVLLELHY